MDSLLRDVVAGDLPAFYEHQLDPDAVRMAAFPSRERNAFFAHWAKVLGNASNINRTIVHEGGVAGYVACFEQGGKRQVAYWIGREFWGKGVATRALTEFLTEVDTRPLHAFVAEHNVASIRVLEKCGFVRCGEESPFEPADGVKELLFRLGEGSG